MKIIIHPQLSKLHRLLDEHERKALTDSIRKRGQSQPILCWPYQDGHAIVDGHNRYAICKELGITPKYDFTTMADASEDEAIEEAVDRQLARRNLTPEGLAYFRGKKYLELAKPAHRPEKVSQVSTLPGKTAATVAAVENVGQSTVRRDAQFTKAVDTIAKNVGEEAKAEILAGKSQLQRRAVVDLASKPADHQKAVMAMPPAKRMKLVKPAVTTDDTGFAVIVDGLGNEVPKNLEPVFDCIPQMKKMMTALSDMKSAVRRYADSDAGFWFRSHVQDAELWLKQIRYYIKATLPFAMTPASFEHEEAKQAGFITRLQHEKIIGSESHD